MTAAFVLVLIIIFSVLMAWKENAMLCMATAGLTMIAGLYAPDMMGGVHITTGIGLTAGLVLIAYSLLCCGWAFRLMFWEKE